MGILLYGVACYSLFFGVFVYLALFLENAFVPCTVDAGGAVTSLGVAAAINTALLLLFGVQHSIMARKPFKKWITRFIPESAERSTFVLATCAVLLLMFWQWRPMPTVIWQAEWPVLRAVLTGISCAGFGLVLYSSFLIDHFDLFGLRQVVLHWKNIKYTHAPFQMPWLYRIVRNPLMLGLLIAFWVTPTLTVGRLLFAVVWTGYICVGVYFEERDLARHLGDDYRRYKARTPAFFPWPRRRPAEAVVAASAEPA